jgi:hypothetical protein
MRLDHITKDHVEVLRFGGSAPQGRRVESPHQGSKIQAEAVRHNVRNAQFTFAANKWIVRANDRIGKSAARSRTQAKTIILQVVENMIRTEEIRLPVD